MSSGTKKTIAIKLKPAAERKVKQGHPWVFDQSIVKQNSEGEAGDLAIVFDQKKNKFLACGLYDPDSPIRIKLLQFHQSAKIDGDWFQNKIFEAFEIRKPLLSSLTNSYRLIYGENDHFPGLIADVYAKVLVVKLYSAIWFPYLEQIVDQLLTVSQCDICVLRLNRALEKDSNTQYKNGSVIRGHLAQPEILFREGKVKFLANVIHGHKTGFFLDHRHNRIKIGAMARGKNVLDVFSYAGGFSVHALVGGARSVASVDISAKALAVAEKNASLNKIDGRHICIANDAFQVLEEMVQHGEQFDLIVIDPPSFAKQATEVPRALKQYERLAILGAKLTAPKGILFLASCSSRVTAEQFFESTLEALNNVPYFFTTLEKTFHDVDHPIEFPEGAYLKGIYLQRK